MPYEGCDSDGYYLCNDEACFSGECGIPPTLKSFSANIGEAFCDPSCLIKCEVCLCNDAGEEIEDMLDEVSGDFSPNDMFDIDPHALCNSDRERLLERAKKIKAE